VLGAGLEDSTEALGEPASGGPRSADDDLVLPELDELQRVEPDLERRLTYGPPELRSELAPGSGGLDVRGQGQATLSGEPGGVMGEEGENSAPGAANIPAAPGRDRRPGGA
jgi:hypothetical protein